MVIKIVRNNRRFGNKLSAYDNLDFGKGSILISLEKR